MPAIASESNTSIPTLQDVRDQLASPAYSAMLNSCQQFESSCGQALGRYRKRWSSLPIRQWSRAWEYPFVLEQLRDLQAPRVLDAGSGATFFPFHIAEQLAGSEVHACDSDPLVGTTFARLPADLSHKVTYQSGCLDSLPYPDRHFDAIYSVSVLEHTSNYGAIAAELWRTLKLSGCLILTFDISYFEGRNIAPSQLESFLRALADRFEGVPEHAEVSALVARPETFNTHAGPTFLDLELPWRLPSLVYKVHSLVKTGSWPAWPPKLTVCGLTLRPRSPESLGA